MAASSPIPDPTSLPAAALTESTQFAEALGQLLAGEELAPPLMNRVMREMIAGRWGDVEVASFLVALRMRGESAAEVAEAARVVRQAMRTLDTGMDGVLDTCGTGGDGAGTFNISSAVALVVAGAGVPVVKHGNRAVSGRTPGSADVMAELGVRIGGGAEQARHCLERAGIAFCFAPDFHPALAHVGAVRKRLPTRTLFNLLGPLTNPARAPYQLIGVGRPEWLDRLAPAAALLGVRHAFVVCGREGLDEVTLGGPTLVREVRGGAVTALEWTPDDFGLEACRISDLAVNSVAESAARIRGVLDGQGGPARQIVLANSAAALLAAERVATLREGVGMAAGVMDTGRARDVLERLIAGSRERVS